MGGVSWERKWLKRAVDLGRGIPVTVAIEDCVTVLADRCVIIDTYGEDGMPVSCDFFLFTGENMAW